MIVILCLGYVSVQVLLSVHSQTINHHLSFLSIAHYCELQ